MNTPTDPREGDRRQKALRAKLQAMSHSNVAAKRLLSRFAREGQARGSVHGPRGVGPRIQGGSPGALSFLPDSPGGGFDRANAFDSANPVPLQGQGAGAQMHVSNPLPTDSLGAAGPSNFPAPLDGPSGADKWVNPESNPFPAPIGGPSGADKWVSPGAPGITSSAGQSSPAGALALPNGLVPVGNGLYLDPTTGILHGAGKNVDAGFGL